MRCVRCGHKIEKITVTSGWWANDISRGYRTGQIHSNGYYCDGDYKGQLEHIPAIFKEYLTYLKKPNGSSCHKQ